MLSGLILRQESIFLAAVAQSAICMGTFRGDALVSLARNPKSSKSMSASLLTLDGLVTQDSHTLHIDTFVIVSA